MSREKLANAALLLAVFLLPWQTRWIFWRVPLNGGAWEYGTLSLYATEVLLVISWVLFGRLQLSFRARTLVRPAFAILAACFFSGAFSSFAIVSAGAMIHVASAFLLFFLLCDERVSSTKALAVFVFGLVVPSLLGWYQVLTGTSPASTLFGLASHLAATPGVSVVELADGTRILRAYGSLPHPNIFGGYLVVGLWAIAALFFRLKKGREWLVLPAMLFAATLVITFSRSAWIALALSALAAMFVAWKKRGELPRDAWPIILGVIIAFAVTAIGFHAAILTRTSTDTRLETNSVVERETGYAEFPAVLLVNPLTGVGVGAYTGEMSLVKPGGAAFDYQPIHNAILLFVGETGLIGLLALLWFLKKIYASVRLPAIALLFGLALFDHYLWSLCAGLVLVAFVLALSVKTEA